MRRLYTAVVKAAQDRGEADHLHDLWKNVIIDAYAGIAKLEARVAQLESALVDHVNGAVSHNE